MTLLKMEKEHIKPVSLMLSRAFKDQFKDIFPDPEERRAKEHYVNEYLLRRDYSYSRSFITSPKLEGIAVWIHSNMNPGRSYWRILTSGAIWPAFKMGRRAFGKVKKFGQHSRRKRKEWAPAKHWFLAALAVDPQHQGKGYASKLLNEMLSNIDEEGLPCYLETEGEKNVSMYKRFGFKVIGEFTIPNTTFDLVAMLREPNIIKKRPKRR